MERNRQPLTVTWPKDLLDFIKGPLFKKIRIKPAQLTELAMEKYLKDNGHWDEYKVFLKEQEEVY